MLRQLADDLWVTERSQRFLGIEVGTRMTVVRLADSSLLLHSVVPLDAELRTELDALGAVRHVVAPNRYHHLYVGDYAGAYPQATLFAAPGLAGKRPDIRFHETLETGREYPWSSAIDHQVCDGMPALSETVFLHKASRSLVVTDLAMNIDATSPLSARLFARVGGIYGKPGLSWIERSLWLRDKRAAADSLEKVRAWEFDRVVMAHGNILENARGASLGSALRF
ncbi:DUF4336 domain-containing protein [bacterium]|nr:MAG: DUF4336 domain-containing protein [bacterium]